MKFLFWLLGKDTSRGHCSNSFECFFSCAWWCFITYARTNTRGRLCMPPEFSLCATFSLAVNSENSSCLGFPGISAPSPFLMTWTLSPGSKRGRSVGSSLRDHCLLFWCPKAGESLLHRMYSFLKVVSGRRVTLLHIARSWPEQKSNQDTFHVKGSSTNNYIW